MTLVKSKIEQSILIREEFEKPDNVIVQDVFVEDCYRVDDLPSPVTTMIDVGSHIGVAAKRVLKRFPKAEIVCVEAHPVNASALRENVGSLCRVHEAAVTYLGGELFIHGTVYDGTANTGGSFIGPKDAHAAYANAQEYQTHTPIQSITIEEIMAERGWSYVDVLKLDCEGSELDILTHTDIRRFGVIVGEWHNREAFMQLVKKFYGWHFDILREGNIGLFRLSQPNWWNRATNKVVPDHTPLA